MPCYSTCSGGGMLMFASPAASAPFPRSMIRKKCSNKVEILAAPEPIKPVIRKEFPETWIWETIQSTR